MTINALNIKNIYLIKGGKVLLSSAYEKGTAENTFPTLLDDFIAIDTELKKATSTNKEKLITRGESFYISTNNRDYDNTILYDLYINEDLITIEPMEDKLTEHNDGDTWKQKQFKATTKADFIVNRLEWVDITEEEYKKLYEEYEARGWWNARNDLMKQTNEYIISEAKKDLENEYKNEKMREWAKARIKRAEQRAKDGFFGMVYKRVKHNLREFDFCSFVYDHIKSKDLIQREKIAELMSSCLYYKAITSNQVEKMLKLLNITIKRGAK